jgi:AcrR family transcriptional regulator
MPPRTATGPAKRRRSFVFALKKQPRQRRAATTFEAIVTAATRLLAARGYAAVTTNHIAELAGVGIGSLYEYFPGKDAIVAQVAQRLVDRVVGRLTEAVPEVLAGPPAAAVPTWIALIHDTLLRERRLVAVFVEEVPYLRHLPAIRGITPRLLALSRAIRSRAGGRLAIEHETASLYLMINLVSTTILQLVLDPPPEVEPDDLLVALAARITAWVLPDVSDPTARAQKKGA